MNYLYDSTDMDKVFKISFHESQTGRKVIDVTADVEHEPVGVSVGHKRSNSIDLSQSTLGTSNDTEKPSPYVNIPQALEYFAYGISDPDSTDSEDTQPLDSAPMMFKPDEDIYISDDGTMITKGDEYERKKTPSPPIFDGINDPTPITSYLFDNNNYKMYTKPDLNFCEKPERKKTTPKFDGITDCKFCD